MISFSDVNKPRATVGFPRAQCVSLAFKHKAFSTRTVPPPTHTHPTLAPRGIACSSWDECWSPQINSLQMFTYGAQHRRRPPENERKAHLHCWWEESEIAVSVHDDWLREEYYRDKEKKWVFMQEFSYFQLFILGFDEITMKCTEF